LIFPVGRLTSTLFPLLLKPPTLLRFLICILAHPRLNLILHRHPSAYHLSIKHQLGHPGSTVYLNFLNRNNKLPLNTRHLPKVNWLVVRLSAPEQAPLQLLRELDAIINPTIWKVPSVLIIKLWPAHDNNHSSPKTLSILPVLDISRNR
jgi:hypothetical protein